MKVSLVIPVYNAAGFLENSINDLERALSASGLAAEVLLRDDGSRDESPDIIRRLAQTHSNVRYFFNFRNLGLGATLRALWRDASGEKVIYLDADLPFGSGILPELLLLLEHSDVVIASRYRGKTNHLPWLRRLTSYAYYLFCEALFHTRIRDIGSGAVAVRREVFSGLFLEATGFSIHIEFLVKVLRAGFKVRELAAESFKTPGGSFSVRKHGFAVIKDTWLLYRKVGMVGKGAPV